jgi:hypothetical protein
MGPVTPAAPLWPLDGAIRRSLRWPACRTFAFGWLAALCLCGLGHSMADAAERSATANAAVNELREAVAELRREDKSYRAFRAAAKKDNPELEEYAAFIAGLQLRVFEQCEVVRAQAGEEAVREFDCIRLTPNRPIVVTVPSASAVQTEEEKRAALNARLNDIEGDVDDSLQKRQQEIRQRQAASTAGGGGGGGGGRGGAAGTKDGTRGTPGQPGESGGPTASAGSIPGQQQPPAAAYGRPGATDAPARQRVMDGTSDDDVVARQLREAAEREADPVLKEKLWAEYKKYREARR